jgi:hypothetical protein
MPRNHQDYEYANPRDWATKFWKHNYIVTLDGGIQIAVNADNEGDALDEVIDYCERKRYIGFVASHGDLDPDEQEEYVSGGNHGLYLTTDYLHIKEV